MKFIIYWLFYTGSFCGDMEISGVVEVTDSTVTSYICPYEYVTWRIVEKNQIVQDNVIIRGDYLLDHKGYKSFMMIDKKIIYQYLGNGEFIYLQRNDKKHINKVDKKKTKRRRINH